jgi:hypothetical protein
VAAVTGAVITEARAAVPVALRALPDLMRLPAIALPDLTQRAALQTRVDRKYLVTTATLAAMMDEIAGSTAALDIDGRRVFGYSSVYFDTDDLLCFREHRQGRRRRFKVRTRSYLDSGDCLLEVKAVGLRGRTVKSRTDHPPAAAGTLTTEGLTFVADALDHHPAVPALRPSVVTDYHRITLLDRESGSRVTIDLGLRFTGSGDTAGSVVAAPQDTVVVETKSAARPGRADRALQRLGARPQSVSKYCVGVALLHPELPANRWHRVLRRHFGAEPGRPLGARGRGRRIGP